ncbi:MAG: NAD(P)-dependent oxidoreductase [Rhizobiaceae bacterium]
MADGTHKDGIVAGRLARDVLADHFSDLHPPLNAHEAHVEADRCYFCHDAPCMTACPTSIDIPLFIRQIATGNPMSAAKTIFSQNIMGGMCARVCPTETLCEEVCVRETAEGSPVKIGQLQRFATDAAMAAGRQFFARGKASGKSVAIAGAGPAGLACAHRLAMHGHAVTVYESRPKAGGLNEYGIASYKATDGIAQREVDYVTAIGGISVKHGKALGKDLSLDSLAKDHDAVFLAIGLGGVNALGAPGEEASEAAVEFIADLRQAADLRKIAIGRRVVVIGGGMTAVDCAVQAKLLGAEEVTICYRRGPDEMNASAYEQDLAAVYGVVIRHWVQPKKVLAKGGKAIGVELEYTAMKGGKLSGTGETVTLAADQVFRAIGQTLASIAGLDLDGGRIKADGEGRTSNPKIWAGGDCVRAGEDLTVTAVAQGRDAAESIHRALGA